MPATATLFLATCLLALPQDPGEDTTFQLDPVEVTARRLPENLLSVPASTRYIGTTTIEDSAASDLVALLESAANLQFRSTTGNPAQAEIDMRGFGENSGLRVLVLVDGEPWNGPDMAAPNWLEIPLSTVESIEVISGPASSYYGDHAVGGVIKITTRRNASSHRAQAFLSAGSYDTYSAQFNATSSHHHNNTSAHLDFQSSGGYRDHSAYQSTTAHIRHGRETPSGNFSARFQYHENRFEFPGGVFSPGGFPENPRASAYGPPFPPGDYESETRRLSAHTSWQSPANADWPLLARAAFRFRQLDWNFGGTYADNRNPSAHLSLQSAATDPPRRWNGGIDFHWDQLDLTLYDTIQRENPFSRARLHNQQTAAFFDRRFHPHESVDFSVSGRLQTSSLNFREFTNGETIALTGENTHTGWASQLALNVRPRESLRFYARADRYFRNPVMDEVASFQGFALEVPFNADLEPETGIGLETGFTVQQSSWFWEVFAYAMWTEGEIAFVPNLNRNFADTRRYGYHQRLTWQSPSRALRFSLDHDLVDARYNGGKGLPGENLDGSPLYLVSRHRIAASLQFRPSPLAALTARARYRSGARSGNDFSGNAPRLTPHVTFDLRLNLRLNDHSRLSLSALNLLDRRNATLKYNSLWYPDHPRTFHARYEATF